MEGSLAEVFTFVLLPVYGALANKMILSRFRRSRIARRQSARGETRMLKGRAGTFPLVKFDRARAVALTVAALAAVAGCKGWQGVSLEQRNLVSPNGAVTQAGDEARTGWYPDQAGLDPAIVGGANFGRLFKTALTLTPGEQVLAQPLVWNGQVLVATESNNLYLLDAVTGAITTSRALGAAYDASGGLGCGDIKPTVGITGTPVIDTSSGTAYFFSKSSAGVWTFYAVDAGTLADRAGFPVTIGGTAQNEPTHVFDGVHQHQRPGLLLMNGVVYAGFGAHCDIGTYRGWIVGVSTTTGQITTLFSTEKGSGANGKGAGVWMSGGGLASDGAGTILFSTGNGYNTNVYPNPIPGNSDPGPLDEAIARVVVQADGSVKTTDFFAPFNAGTLGDSDLGSGGVVVLPPQFGTTSVPRLAMVSGKEGYFYLLNRDHLGGYKQGAAGGDAYVARVPLGGGTWQRPSAWPGDGGYMYVMTNGGTGSTGYSLQALAYGTDGNGNPTATIVAKSAENFGSYSGSPIVTSNGTTSGSALVWAISNTGELRAYDAVPVAGALTLRFHDAYGTEAKFTTVGVGAGRVYVGSGDGNLIGYGAIAPPPVSGGPVDFGTVVIGQSPTINATLTANTNMTVTGFATSNPAFTVGASMPGLPAAMTAGQTLTVPVTFAPTTPGAASASLTVTTSTGTANVTLTGTGQVNGPQLVATPATVNFGGVATGTSKSLSVLLQNAGSQTLTFAASTPPAAPFSASGLPDPGTTLASGASVTATVTFSPTTDGTWSGSLGVGSDGGNVSIALAATSGAPPLLQITPMTVDYGQVATGAAAVMTFAVKNVGGTDLTITKSKPPALGPFAATTSLTEGAVITAGQTVTESVTFSSPTAGSFSDVWVITGNDTTGTQNVAFTAAAVAPLARTGWVATAAPASATDVPGNALDGNAGTRFSTGVAMAPGQWWQVDMLGPQTFGLLTMDAGGSVGDYAHGYQVFVSNDGVSFGLPVASGTGTTQSITVSFPTQVARYVRVVQTQTVNPNWWSIAEFNVYGTAGGTPPPAPQPPTGLAAGNPTTATIDLAWAASPTAGVTYSVFRGTTSGFAPGAGTLVASGLTGLAYTDANLASATTYYYLVETAGTGGASTPSNQASATTQSTGTLTALSRTGWVASAQPASATDVPANAIDGNANTRFSTGAAQVNGQWFQVDMLAAQSFSRVVMDSTASANDYARGYQVFVSNDGATWGNAIATGTGTAAVITVNFPSQSARYLRIIQTSSATSWWSIHEFNVYGGGTTPPNPPTGLAATAASSSAINLSWTASTTSGVTYSVFRSTTSGFTASTANQIASGLSGLTYADSGLAASTTYYYLAKANGAGGASAASNQASAATQAAPPPSPPTALAATAASSSAINLSWTASSTSGVTYSLFRSTTSGFTASTANQIASGLSTLTYADAGLAASTTYYYLAQAVGSTGTSASSNQASATTQAPPPPNPPTALAATAASSSAINLSWTASTTSGVTYSVFRSTTSGFTASSANQIASGLTALTYADSGLTASTTYYYLAQAVGSTGTSASSNQASATTQAPPPPSPPTALGASAASSSAINLSWTASTTSGVTYTVYRSTTNGFTASSGNQIASGLTAVTYADSGLAASTTYYYLAQAVGSTGTSASSNQASATTQAPPPPNPPTALAATAASSSAINLSWTASTTSGVTYTVYRSTTSGFTASSANQIASGVNALTYADSGLTASTTYYYLAKAVGSTGTSAASNQASATTQAAGGGPLLLARTGWVATASVTGGTDVAAQAIDASATTRWSTGVAQANGQWFQIDLQSAQTFDQLVMASNADYARGYQVFVSSDGATWGTAVATGTGTTQTISVSFAAQTKRYVRVVQTSTTAGSWWSIYDLNLWNNHGNPPPVAYARTSWTATASSTGGTDTPPKAIDTTAGTRWSSGVGQAPGQWFQIDMGVAQPFVEIVMDSTGSNTDYAHGYQVFVSNDGTNWGSAVASGTPTGPVVTVSLSSTQTARYVRVVQTSTTPGSWWSMYDVNVLHY
jgi:fibronectin type 3 domain-containing protein